MIVLAVMLIASIVALMNSIPLSIKTIYGYSRHYLGVTPRGDAARTPVIRATIEQESPVRLDRVMTARGSNIQVKSIVGKWPFVILALSPQDIEYYIKRMGGGKLEGRLPEAGQPEVVVSEPLLRNLNRKLGDVLLKPDDPEAFSPNQVKIVGVLRSSEWLILAPIDYYRANHFPPVDVLVVFAGNDQDQKKLDKWAEERFRGENAMVFAYHILQKQTDETFHILYRILNVVISILVVVITIMMGMLINIYQSQRIQEFGLLQALGYTKRRLLGRTMAETSLVVIGGWLLGLGMAWLTLNLVNGQLMHPNAFMLDTFDFGAYAYTIPVPIAISLVAWLTLVRNFRKFDPVGIVERRLV